MWGKIAVINLYGCNSELIRNKKEIKRFIVSLCEQIRMKRMGKPLIKRFGSGSLEGVSAMQFIETSSITLHFDETENRAFIDIFSCKDFDEKEAERFSKEFFRAGDSRATILIRE